MNRQFTCPHALLKIQYAGHTGIMWMGKVRTRTTLTEIKIQIITYLFSYFYL